MEEKPQARSKQQWFAVCCKSREEPSAATNLRRQGYKVYLPKIETTKRRRGRYDAVIEPLFPRYLFARFNPSRKSAAPIRSTRGVIGLVRFCGVPAPIPDEVIAALKAREVNGLHGDSSGRLTAGDKIELLDGPFSGFTAVFTERDGNHRVAVLLDALGTRHRLVVSRHSIARL